MAVITGCLLFQTTHVFGQQSGSPLLASGGNSISDFLPAGWTVLDSATGDLNNDGREDIAVIFQHGRGVEESLADTIAGTQSRILLILFRTTTGTLQPVEQNNTFILCDNDPDRLDPYQSIGINEELLEINLHLFYMTGTWYATNNTYRFHYHEGEFVLTEAGTSSFHRASGALEEYRYNFVAGTVRHLSGNMFDEQAETITEQRRLPIEKLPTLRTFRQPYTWEVEPGIVL